MQLLAQPFYLQNDFLLHEDALLLLICWRLSDGEVNKQDCERAENDTSDKPDVAH